MPCIPEREHPGKKEKKKKKVRKTSSIMLRDKSITPERNQIQKRNQKTKETTGAWKASGTVSSSHLKGKKKERPM